MLQLPCTVLWVCLFFGGELGNHGIAMANQVARVCRPLPVYYMREKRANNDYDSECSLFHAPSVPFRPRPPFPPPFPRLTLHGAYFAGSPKKSVGLPRGERGGRVELPFPGRHESRNFGDCHEQGIISFALHFYCECFDLFILRFLYRILRGTVCCLECIKH